MRHRRISVSPAVVVGMILLVGGIWGGSEALRRHNVTRLGNSCAEAQRRGDWSRLESDARDWLNRDSESVDAARYLATAVEERGDLAGAADVLRRIPLRTDAGIDAAVRLAGMQFGSLNRPLEGLETCRRIVAADPANSAARAYMIHFLAMTFQRVELIRAIREAIEHRAEQPEHYLHLLLLDDLSFRDGREITSRWLLQSPESELLRAAAAAHAARETRARALKESTPETQAAYTSALQRVADLLDIYPRNATLIEIQLIRCLDSGSVDELSQWLTRVPESHAADPVFWRYRGWYYSAVGESEQAELAYQRAIQIHPLSWQSRHDLAGVLRREQRATEVESLQSVAAQGQALAKSARELEHVRDVPESLLRELADYALRCNDWPIADALYGRLPPE